MPLILSAEEVVRRIAADCAFVDDKCGVGIRLQPAAAIVRAYGAQLRIPQNRKPVRRSPKKQAALF
jgi:hypothetical protein